MTPNNLMYFWDKMWLHFYTYTICEFTNLISTSETKEMIKKKLWVTSYNNIVYPSGTSLSHSTVSNIAIKITIFFYDFILLKSSHKFLVLLTVCKTNINLLYFSTMKIIINLEAYDTMMKNTSIWVRTWSVKHYCSYKTFWSQVKYPFL